LQDFVFLAPIRIVGNHFLDAFVNGSDLFIEQRDDFFDALFDCLLRCPMRSVCLHCFHLDQLFFSRHKIAHLLRFTGRNGSRWQALELCKSCEDACIDGIGLGKFAESFGKVSCLSGIDSRCGYSVGNEMGEEFSFKSSRGFKDDLLGFDFLEEFYEFLDSFFGMGNCALLIRGEDVHDKFCFGDINADESGFIAFPLGGVVFIG